MKSIIVLSVLLVSSFSMACPNLSGQWTCVTGTGPHAPAATTEIITQQNIHGGVSYEIPDGQGKTVTYYADGTSHPIKEGILSGTATVNCDGEDEITGNETLDGPQIQMVGDFTYEMHGADSMTGTFKGTFKTPIGTTPLSTTTTCTLKN